MESSKLINHSTPRVQFGAANRVIFQKSKRVKKMVNFAIIILLVKTIELKKFQRPKFCESKKKESFEILGE
jgi:hypothetical protein